MGRTLFTTITPLPANIPRKLAIDLLQNHKEMIELNPLVIDTRPIKAPKDAPADEFFAVWHEMTDRVQYIPGMGKLASSKVTYKGVFHDMPWGLQTHIYAPLGLDIRDKWQIRGNQPGEPREMRELGDKAPHDGLYLREDVDMTCNRMMTAFVKKNLVTAHAVLVDRLMKKAELLDAGVLQAMMEEGRIKTINPAVQNSFSRAQGMTQEQQLPSQIAQAPYSPGLMSPQMLSPQQSYYDPKNANHPAFRGQDEENRQSQYLPPYQDQGGYHNDMAKTTTTPSASAYARQSQYSTATPRQYTAELPGSTYHASQPSPHLVPHPAVASHRASVMSELSGSSPTDGQYSWSPSLRPTGDSDRSSVTSEHPLSYHQLRGLPSPGLPSDRTSMVSELATPPMQQHGFQQR